MRKILSSLILNAFITTSVIPANALSAETPSQPQKGSQEEASQAKPGGNILAPEQIRIPEDYGRKKEAFQGTNGRLVIHIQDAHANFEAQTNIASIIDHLATEMGLELVAVEGSEGVIDTSLFASFPDEEIKREVATYFMKKGKITGPEFLSITSNHPLTLYGIENKELYLENLKSFLDSLKYREEAVRTIADIEQKIDALKEKIYQGDVKEFDAKELAYSKEELSLTDYLTFLKGEANRKKVILEGYPNVHLLLEAIELEKGIDFDAVEKERTALIDLLGQKLKKEELSDLLVKSLNFKLKTVSSSEYYHYLETLATQSRYDWAKAPNLNSYIRYINLSDRVDSEVLFDELKVLTADVKKKLFRDETEEKLDHLSKNIKILKGLFELKLSLDEVDYYRAHRDEFPIKLFTSFIAEVGKSQGVSIPETRQDLIDAHLVELEHFYDVAQKRDQILVENMLGRMLEDDKKACVLITGGFHTDGVTQLLKKEHVSYVVIAPKITQLDAETPYIDVMTGKKTPFEELVTGGEEGEEAKLAVTSQVSEGGIASQGDGITQDEIERTQQAILSSMMSELLARVRKSGGEVDRETVNRIADRWARNMKDEIPGRAGRRAAKELQAFSKSIRVLEGSLLIKTPRGEMKIPALPEAIPSPSRRGAFAGIAAQLKPNQEAVTGAFLAGQGAWLLLDNEGRAPIFAQDEVDTAINAYRDSQSGVLKPGTPQAHVADVVGRYLDEARTSVWSVVEKLRRGDVYARASLEIMGCTFCGIAGVVSAQQGGLKLHNPAALSQDAIRILESRGFDNYGHVEKYELILTHDEWAAVSDEAKEDLTKKYPARVIKGMNDDPVHILFFAIARGVGSATANAERIGSETARQVREVVQLIFGRQTQAVLDNARGDWLVESVGVEHAGEHRRVTLLAVNDHTRYKTKGGDRKSNAHQWIYKGYTLGHNGDFESYREFKVILEDVLGEEFEGTTDSEVLLHLIGDLGEEKDAAGKPTRYAPSEVAITRAFRLIENVETLLAARRVLQDPELPTAVNSAIRGAVEGALSRFNLKLDDVLQDSQYGEEVPRAVELLIRKAVAEPRLFDTWDVKEDFFQRRVMAAIDGARNSVQPAEREKLEDTRELFKRLVSEIAINVLSLHDDHDVVVAQQRAKTEFVLGRALNGSIFMASEARGFLPEEVPLMVKRQDQDSRYKERVIIQDEATGERVLSVARGYAQAFSSKDWTIHIVDGKDVRERSVLTGAEELARFREQDFKFNIIHDAGKFWSRTNFESEFLAQPVTVQWTLEALAPWNEKTGRYVLLPETGFPQGFWREVSVIEANGSGTSNNALKLINADDPIFDFREATDEAKSDFAKAIGSGSVVIVVSQSGTTGAARTVLNMVGERNKEILARGGKPIVTICLTNRRGSAIYQTVNYNLVTESMDELAVAASGSNSTQRIALKLLALHRARDLNLLTEEGVQKEIRKLYEIPARLQGVIDSFKLREGRETPNLTAVRLIADYLKEHGENGGVRGVNMVGVGYDQLSSAVTDETAMIKLLEVMRYTNTSYGLSTYLDLGFREVDPVQDPLLEEEWTGEHAQEAVAGTLEEITDGRGNLKFRKGVLPEDRLIKLSDETIQNCPEIVLMAGGRNDVVTQYLQIVFKQHAPIPIRTLDYDTPFERTDGRKPIRKGAIVLAFQPESDEARLRLEELAALGAQIIVLGNIDAEESFARGEAGGGVILLHGQQSYLEFSEIVAGHLLLVDLLGELGVEAFAPRIMEDGTEEVPARDYHLVRWVNEARNLGMVADAFSRYPHNSINLKRLISHLNALEWRKINFWATAKSRFYPAAVDFARWLYRHTGINTGSGETSEFKHGSFSAMHNDGTTIFFGHYPGRGKESQDFIKTAIEEVRPRIIPEQRLFQDERRFGNERHRPGMIVTISREDENDGIVWFLEDDNPKIPPFKNAAELRRTPKERLGFKELRRAFELGIDEKRTARPDIGFITPSGGILERMLIQRLIAVELGKARRAYLEDKNIAPGYNPHVIFNYVTPFINEGVEKDRYLSRMRALRRRFPNALIVTVGNPSSDAVTRLFENERRVLGERFGKLSVLIEVPSGEPTEMLVVGHHLAQMISDARFEEGIDYLLDTTRRLRQAVEVMGETTTAEVITSYFTYDPDAYYKEPQKALDAQAEYADARSKLLRVLGNEGVVELEREFLRIIGEMNINPVKAVGAALDRNILRHFIFDLIQKLAKVVTNQSGVTVSYSVPAMQRVTVASAPLSHAGVLLSSNYADLSVRTRHARVMDDIRSIVAELDPASAQLEDPALVSRFTEIANEKVSDALAEAVHEVPVPPGLNMGIEWGGDRLAHQRDGWIWLNVNAILGPPALLREQIKHELREELLDMNRVRVEFPMAAEGVSPSDIRGALKEAFILSLEEAGYRPDELGSVRATLRGPNSIDTEHSFDLLLEETAGPEKTILDRMRVNLNYVVMNYPQLAPAAHAIGAIERAYPGWLDVHTQTLAGLYETVTAQTTGTPVATTTSGDGLATSFGITEINTLGDRGLFELQQLDLPHIQHLSDLVGPELAGPFAEGDGISEDSPGAPAPFRRIFVVDDDPTMRALYSDLFESLRADNNLIAPDTEVLTFESVSSAMAAMEEGKPDLILSDNGITSSDADDGMEWRKELLGDPGTAGIPFILISGRTESLDPAILEDHGVSHTLAKPFRISQLTKVMANAATETQGDGVLEEGARRVRSEEVTRGPIMRVVIIEQGDFLREKLRTTVKDWGEAVGQPVDVRAFKSAGMAGRIHIHFEPDAVVTNLAPHRVGFGVDEAKVVPIPDSMEVSDLWTLLDAVRPRLAAGDGVAPFERILIVGGEETARTDLALQLMIGRWNQLGILDRGVKIKAVEGMAEALDALARYKPDLVISQTFVQGERKTTLREAMLKRKGARNIPFILVGEDQPDQEELKKLEIIPLRNSADIEGELKPALMQAKKWAPKERGPRKAQGDGLAVAKAGDFQVEFASLGEPSAEAVVGNVVLQVAEVATLEPLRVGMVGESAQVIAQNGIVAIADKGVLENKAIQAAIQSGDGLLTLFVTDEVMTEIKRLNLLQEKNEIVPFANLDEMAAVLALARYRNKINIILATDEETASVFRSLTVTLVGTGIGPTDAGFEKVVDEITAILVGEAA